MQQRRSDPVADMLVNSFDLVRTHLFGDQDKPEDRDSPITKRPSYLSMVNFIQDDPKYKAQVVASRYGGIQALRGEFSDEDVEAGYDNARNSMEHPGEISPEELALIDALTGTPLRSDKNDGVPISSHLARSRPRKTPHRLTTGSNRRR